MSALIFNSHIFVLVIVVAISWFALGSVDEDNLKPFALRWGAGLAVAALLVFVFSYGEGFDHGLAQDSALAHLVAAQGFQVGTIGMFVGLVELVARYKDDPKRALATAPALLYLLLNVIACIAILRVLKVIHPDWLFKYEGRRQELYLVLVAGFGAVALFRSSIFKVKTSDGEISVGPAIILDTLLAASDRAVDRIIASPRGTKVSSVMSQVSFERAKLALPAYCFALMQNVSHQEQKDIADQVNSLTTSNMPDRVRALNLGLALLNVVGETVLASAVKDLGSYIEGERSIEETDVGRVAALMREVSFERASTPLPIYCLALNPTVPAQSQTTFAEQVKALNLSSLSPRVKALMLGLALVGLVGFPVLHLAVTQLDSEIKA